MFQKIHDHVLDKNTRNLYRFFFLPLSTANTSTRSLVRSPCKTRALCVQRLCGPQYYLSSFQLFQQKWCSRGRFNCIFTLACKGPVCIDVLTSFYGRFFVEVRQFINSKSLYIVPPEGCEGMISILHVRMHFSIAYQARIT